jgi:Cu-Zn family superoxide dismutase
MKVKLLASALLICFFVGCVKVDMVKPALSTYPLPGNQFFPEGIAYNPRTGIFYTGSTTNGDILQVNVETGATALFAAGAKQGRTFATGMKLDSRDRLWVCGGSQGVIQVLSSSGDLIKAWDAKALFNAGFVNDCIISDGYIYFTDSQMRKIYRTRVNTQQPGELEEWLTFTDQQIPYATGTNANGIEATPDGKYLIVVISNSGKLFRINISNKSIAEIQLTTPVNSGDGLLLDGNTLYVSRNATGLIFPVELNKTYTQGTVGFGFGNGLLFNTTLAKAGKYLLVVNGQLNRRSGNPPAVLPFSVSRVAIPD